VQAAPEEVAALEPRCNRAAAEYLLELLVKPGRYRDTWRRNVARPREDVINEMAGAKVLGAHAEPRHTRREMTSCVSAPRCRLGGSIEAPAQQTRD